MAEYASPVKTHILSCSRPTTSEGLGLRPAMQCMQNPPAVLSTLYTGLKQKQKTMNKQRAGMARDKRPTSKEEEPPFPNCIM